MKFKDPKQKKKILIAVLSLFATVSLVGVLIWFFSSKVKSDKKCSPCPDVWFDSENNQIPDVCVADTARTTTSDPKKKNVGPGQCTNPCKPGETPCFNQDSGQGYCISADGNPCATECVKENNIPCPDKYDKSVNTSLIKCVWGFPVMPEDGEQIPVDVTGPNSKFCTNPCKKQTGPSSDLYPCWNSVQGKGTCMSIKTNPCAVMCGVGGEIECYDDTENVWEDSNGNAIPKPKIKTMCLPTGEPDLQNPVAGTAGVCKNPCGTEETACFSKNEKKGRCLSESFPCRDYCGNEAHIPCSGSSWYENWAPDKGIHCGANGLVVDDSACRNPCKRNAFIPTYPSLASSSEQLNVQNPTQFFNTCTPCAARASAPAPVPYLRFRKFADQLPLSQSINPSNPFFDVPVDATEFVFFEGSVVALDLSAFGKKQQKFSDGSLVKNDEDDGGWNVSTVELFNSAGIDFFITNSTFTQKTDFRLVNNQRQSMNIVVQDHYLALDTKIHQFPPISHITSCPDEWINLDNPGSPPITTIECREDGLPIQEENSNLGTSRCKVQCLDKEQFPCWSDQLNKGFCLKKLSGQPQDDGNCGCQNNCVHGKCKNYDPKNKNTLFGTCECDPGYTGPLCSQKIKQ